MDDLRFEDCRALCRLPYFEPEPGTGLPRLADGVADDIVDAHLHLGWSYGLAPAVDLAARHERAETFFPETGVAVDLSHYSAWDYTDEVAAQARRHSARSIWSGKGPIATFTVPNLLREMDRLGVRDAIVLAIEYPFASRCTERFLDATADCDRLHVFCSVHPFGVGNGRRVARAVERGAVGMKLHPATQFVRAEHPRMIAAARLAQRHGLPILYHVGQSPIAPRWTDRFCSVAQYEAAIEATPEVPVLLGHSGIDEWEQALALCKRHDHVYLELSGQPPQRIRRMLDEVGPDRLVFGSDWPFYPISLPLAKVLIATEGDDEARRKVLAGTIRRLVRSLAPAPLGASASC
ncbi:MAG: hypothetical protein D6776_08155 [Planctomycetota bacterium]|nr:MAG: hypothetical protein D6776_08155 [Planctomycetota bacterium]